MTMTDRNAQAWSHLDPKWREKRMREWAEMLERRVAQLDPDYEFYHWGRRDEVQVLDARGLLVLPNAQLCGGTSATNAVLNGKT